MKLRKIHYARISSPCPVVSCEIAC